MPSPTPIVSRRPAEPHSVGFMLVAIMLAVLMVALAAAYGLSAMFEHHRAPATLDTSAPPMTLKLVGKTLSVPPGWLRTPGQEAGAFASQIGLQLSLPLGRNGRAALVDVTLMPLSQVRPSASLLDGVYLHQFMPNELSGPPGLIGKPLYGTEGYQDETVWYDALSQNPFVAKCAAALDPDAPARCLRSVALPDGIAAVYAFDADVLYSWREFDPVLQQWLGRIGAL